MTKWWSVLFTIVILAGIKIWNPDPVKSLRYIQYDYLQSQQEVIKSNDIVLVNIDEKAIQKEGQYPWPRDIVAKYINQGPPNSLYALNMLYSEEDRFKGDLQLQQALLNKAAVLSSAPTNQLSEGVGVFVGVATLGEQNHDWLYKFPGLLYPIDTLSSAAYGVGATVSIPDQPTGVVRRAPLVINANGVQYPSFPLDVTRVFAGEPSYQMKVGSNGVEWVRIGRQPVTTTNSFSELNISFWNQFEQISILDPLPDGKILIFGVTAEGYSNPVPTPTGAKYPHEVQAHLVQTLISGVQIQEPDWSAVAELGLLLILCLSMLVAVYALPTALSAIAGVLLLSASYGVSQHFWSSLLFVDTTFSFFGSLIVFAQSSFNKYYTTFKQKEQIKKQFGTYLSPDLVKQLQDNPDMLVLGGQRKEMTFLFMDICGFTPVSEYYKNKDDPEGLVQLINMYLDRMTKIILNNGGTIDKYMGDCIMAFWNAPLDCEDHASLAVKSAREISEAADELIKELEEQGLPRIDVGIGINTGDCIVGNMGSEVRFDYSVIGDAVNLASRLEGQTRNYDGVRVLLSARTAGASEEGLYTRVDSIQVKGKSESIEVFTI